ncbi:hypothetical protein IC1_06623 [Bacillus cereus VD022]|uniref:Uncharacterized protein n=1 Tax=Bacillus cereus TIAC219 TaxID=718222 RepID=A0ABC9SQH3_BACCE|nr:hypothetical protein IC1_06623 [Bacillus cereus VD022]EOQ57836.1 hypothetical protein IAY_06250 [Bacillus cereus TIAC219]
MPNIRMRIIRGYAVIVTIAAILTYVLITQ